MEMITILNLKTQSLMQQVDFFSNFQNASVAGNVIQQKPFTAK